MEKISDHITYAEGTKSQNAVRARLRNEPGSVELENMKRLAEKVFEPLRAHFNVPLAITSFYRTRTVNALARGSSSTSQHCKGEAMDIDADVFGGVKNSELFKYIKKNLDYDQLIWEYGNDTEPGWVHVSFKKEGNRKRNTEADTVKGEPVYHNL